MTHEGDEAGMGIPKDTTTTTLEVVTVRDGRVTRSQEFYDTWTAARAIAE